MSVTHLYILAHTNDFLGVKTYSSSLNLQYFVNNKHDHVDQSEEQIPVDDGTESSVLSLKLTYPHCALLARLLSEYSWASFWLDKTI